MTADEKFDRMTDRIDALTQSVELLAAMHRDNEKSIVSSLEKMSNAIERLANIAEAHEQRIEDLENGKH